MYAKALLALALATAFSGGSTTAAPKPTLSTTPPAPVVASAPPTDGASDGASTSTAPSAASKGCPAGGGGIPAGAKTGPIIDVDGDGKADTGWLLQAKSGDVTAGVKTASGATFSTPFGSASPVKRSLFVADATGTGQVVALLDDGRQASLLRVQGCAFRMVLNPQGAQYTFDFGFTGYGTGVGCSRVAGATGRTLVGLNLNRDAGGKAQSVSRTQVVLDGERAKNGLKDVVKSDAKAEQSAQEVSCGDLSEMANGISIEQ